MARKVKIAGHKIKLPNGYRWATNTSKGIIRLFYQRDGKAFSAVGDFPLKAVKKQGVEGIKYAIRNHEAKLKRRLRRKTGVA